MLLKCKEVEARVYTDMRQFLNKIIAFEKEKKNVKICRRELSSNRVLISLKRMLLIKKSL